MPKYVRPMASKKKPAETGPSVGQPLAQLTGAAVSIMPGESNVFACSTLPVPASGERLNCGLARSFEAMRRIVPFMDGKIDRPYPGPPMVSKSAEQRNPADDLAVRDHFVLGGISCRLQQQIGHRRALPQSSSVSRWTAGASGFLYFSQSGDGRNGSAFRAALRRKIRTERPQHSRR